MSTVTDLTTPCGTQADTKPEEERQKGAGQTSQRDTEEPPPYCIPQRAKYNFVLKLSVRLLISEYFVRHWSILLSKLLGERSWTSFTIRLPTTDRRAVLCDDDDDVTTAPVTKNYCSCSSLHHGTTFLFQLLHCSNVTFCHFTSHHMLCTSCFAIKCCMCSTLTSGARETRDTAVLSLCISSCWLQKCQFNFSLSHHLTDKTTTWPGCYTSALRLSIKDKVQELESYVTQSIKTKSNLRYWPHNVLKHQKNTLALGLIIVKVQLNDKLEWYNTQNPKLTP